MDDLIEKYGQGIGGQLGWDSINCGRVGGRLFSLTQGRDLAASYGFAYRLDLAEKYNLDMDSVKTLRRPHDVLVTIKKNRRELLAGSYFRRRKHPCLGWDLWATDG